MKRISILLFIIVLIAIQIYHFVDISVVVNHFIDEQYEYDNESLTISSSDSIANFYSRISRVYCVFDDGSMKEISIDDYTAMLIQDSNISSSIIKTNNRSYEKYFLSDANAISPTFGVSSSQMELEWKESLITKSKIMSFNFEKKTHHMPIRDKNMVGIEYVTNLIDPLLISITDESSIRLYLRHYVKYSQLDVDVYLEIPNATEEGIIGYIEIRTN